MLTILFLACAAVVLVAQGVILHFMLSQRAIVPAPRSLPSPRRPAEIGWAIIPALGLIAVLWFTWIAVHEASTASTVAPGDHGHSHGAVSQ